MDKKEMLQELQGRFDRYFEEREELENLKKQHKYVDAYEENPFEKVLQLILFGLEATYGISIGFTLGKTCNNMFNLHFSLTDLKFSDWNMKLSKVVDENYVIEDITRKISYITYDNQSLEEVQSFFQKMEKVKTSDIENGTLFVEF